MMGNAEGPGKGDNSLGDGSGVGVTETKATLQGREVGNGKGMWRECRG